MPGKKSKISLTADQIASLDLLRRREGFEGYVHIKLLPGAEPAQVEEAARLATRISVNLEGPGDTYVRRLARDKDFSGDLLPKLEHAGRLFSDARRAGTDAGSSLRRGRGASGSSTPARARSARRSRRTRARSSGATGRPTASSSRRPARMAWRASGARGAACSSPASRRARAR